MVLRILRKCLLPSMAYRLNQSSDFSPTPTTTDDLSVSIGTLSVDPEGLTCPVYSYQWFRNGILEVLPTRLFRSQIKLRFGLFR